MHSRTRELRKDNVRAGSLPLRTVPDTVVYSLRLVWRLRRLRPDLVHTNSLKAGIYGSIAARLTGTPVVWHLRDRIDTDYLPPLAIRLIRALTCRIPNVVISNSVATMLTVRPREHSAVTWQIVPDMTINVEQAQPQEERCRSLVVGMIGRLAPWKGQDVFLRAFARAQLARVVGAPLFGDAEVAYAETLRRLADDLGIANRVEFRGHRDDIASELRAIDVLVHASTIPEPFGQVVVEGMSAALPVVASRGGPDEIITDTVDGFLYPPGDVATLAQILVRLEADPQLRGQLARAAAQRAQDYSPAAISAQIIDAYELAKRPGGH
jgi:glycosyltransferase involved in cell wall biosynthesis